MVQQSRFKSKVAFTFSLMTMLFGLACAAGDDQVVSKRTAVQENPPTKDANPQNSAKETNTGEKLPVDHPALTCQITASTDQPAPGSSVKISMSANGEVDQSTLLGKSYNGLAEPVTITVTALQQIVGEVHGPLGSAQCRLELQPKQGKAPTCILAASENAIASGESTTLSLSVSGDVTTTRMDGKEVAFPTQVEPAETTEFTVIVTGPYGDSRCSIKIAVDEEEPLPPPPTCQLSVDQNVVKVGTQVNFKIKTEHAVSETFLNNQPTTFPTSQSISAGGRYTAKVIGPGGSSECHVDVTAESSALTLTCELTAEPAYIHLGQSASLSMTASGKYTGVRLTGGSVQTESATFPYKVTPSFSTASGFYSRSVRYTATVTGEDGPAECHTDLFVSARVPLTGFAGKVQALARDGDRLIVGRSHDITVWDMSNKDNPKLLSHTPIDAELYPRESYRPIRMEMASGKLIVQFRKAISIYAITKNGQLNIERTTPLSEVRWIEDFDFLGQNLVVARGRKLRVLKPDLTVSNEMEMHARKLVVMGQFVFAYKYDNTFAVLDYSNPDKPEHVGSLSINVNYDHGVEVQVHGQYVYLSTAQEIHIIDVTDKKAPKIVRSIEGHGPLDVVGDYLYFSNGFKWLDLNNSLTAKVADKLNVYGDATRPDMKAANTKILFSTTFARFNADGSYRYHTQSCLPSLFNQDRECQKNLNFTRIRSTANGLYLAERFGVFTLTRKGEYLVPGPRIDAAAPKIEIKDDKLFVGSEKNLKVYNISSTNPVEIESINVPFTISGISVVGNEVFLSGGRNAYSFNTVDFRPVKTYGFGSKNCDARHTLVHGTTLIRDCRSLTDFTEHVEFYDTTSSTSQIVAVAQQKGYNIDIALHKGHVVVAGYGLATIDPEDLSGYSAEKNAKPEDFASYVDIKRYQLGLSIINQQAFVASYNNWVQIVNVSNPKQLENAGSIQDSLNPTAVHGEGNAVFVADSTEPEVVWFLNPKN